MAFIRVYTGPDGETHFEDMEIPYEVADLAPDSKTWASSSLRPGLTQDHALSGLYSPKTKGVLFGRQMKGHVPEIKPTGQRHYYIGIAGMGELENGKGEVQRLGADVALLEDMTGRGHIARVVEEPWIWVAVMLDE